MDDVYDIGEMFDEYHVRIRLDHAHYYKKAENSVDCRRCPVHRLGLTELKK
jgi:hypothetical protein